jgi:polysaccharide pyruvyl transferase WcaK-like protein
MVETPAVPTRIAFLSPSGGGNLGDAAIVDSLIHGIRRRVADADIVGFTGNPSDTLARHGVPAFNMRAPFGHDEGPSTQGDPSVPVAPTPAPAQARPGAVRLVRRALGAVPGARATWKTVVHLAADQRYYGPIGQRLRSFDYVVVAGGGQFDALFGGSFRHPYALWRYGSMARRAGARYVILSVGTGTLTLPSRTFVRWALSLADYASFRDERSRELVGDGARERPVVPDLAYALPLEEAPTPPSAGRVVVGISPMAYMDPRAWPKQDQARFQRHIDTLARLAVGAVRAGHEVVLFVTDGPDREPLEELLAAARSQLGPEERERVRVPGVSGVRQLMQVLAGIDLVVAARLHGVLLSHVAGRPVLGIAHERKVATLMKEMGHSAYCHDIDTFDPGRGLAQLEELAARRQELAATIRAVAGENRRRVEAQYDRIFGAA